MSSRMWLISLATIAALILVVFVVSMLIPPGWRIERSTIVRADPKTIYPLIANLKAGWVRWNPWQEASMMATYSGPDVGVGATQEWTGGDTNGGVIRIVRSEPERFVEFALNFGAFPIHGTITMQPTDEGTLITWTDDGRIAGLPIYRYMRLMLERFVGRPMERGLYTLKQIAEGR